MRGNKSAAYHGNDKFIMIIDIIGKGNVGWHLHNALKNKANTRLIDSRTLEGIREDSDISLICVSDNAISEIASSISKLVKNNTVVAHTAGSTPMSEIEKYHDNVGVFYPLQTFNKDVVLNYENIPVFIEAKNDYALSIINNVASLFSNEIRLLDSEKRQKLHVASVFACNFVNHLWSISDKLLIETGLSIDFLKPLIAETAHKIEMENPSEVQTGPAKRHDSVTICRHIKALQKDKELLGIYQMLTNSIMYHHPKQ